MTVPTGPSQRFEFRNHAAGSPGAEPIGGRTALVLAGIICGAFLLRFFYLLQIENIPFFYSLVSDAQAYNDWADQIGQQSFWGTTPFYQAPAYPYFLALAKSLTGGHMFWVRLLQCVLGALSCGAIGLAGCWFFNRRIGLCSAGILAVYGPGIFITGLIQKTALGEFLGCLLLALLAWQQYKPTRLKPLTIGAVLALFALTRENALILAPPVALWLWITSPTPSTFNKALHSALMLLGLALLLLPVGIRNQQLGGGLSLTTVQLGPNFYIGNNAQATGRYRPLVKGHETPEFEQADATSLAQEALGRTLSPSEVSNYWLAQSWAFIRSQPAAWLELLAYKFALVWNAYEIPDTQSYSVYTEWSWLLGTLGGLCHFGVLAPAAAAGLWLTGRSWRRLWLLYAMILLMTAAVASFFVFGRYRYPLVPVLVLFAGAGLVQGWAAWSSRQHGRVLKCLAVTLVTAVAVNWPINPQRQLDAMAWGNLGIALARQDRIAPAVGFFERAVAGAPDAAEMRYNLGLAYAKLDRPAEAADQLRAALVLDAQLIEVDFQLATVLEQMGELVQAADHYRRALKRNPADRDAAQAIERLQEPAN